MGGHPSRWSHAHRDLHLDVCQLIYRYCDYSPSRTELHSSLLSCDDNCSGCWLPGCFVWACATLCSPTSHSLEEHTHIYINNIGFAAFPAFPAVKRVNPYCYGFATGDCRCSSLSRIARTDTGDCRCFYSAVLLEVIPVTVGVFHSAVLIELISEGLDVSSLYLQRLLCPTSDDVSDCCLVSG